MHIKSIKTTFILSQIYKLTLKKKIIIWIIGSLFMEFNKNNDKFLYI